MVKIPFGDWLPDQPAFGNKGATVARNVIPINGTYEQMGDFGIIEPTALDARAQGAISVQDDSFNSYTFAGDASMLYKLTGSTWDDVSVAGGYTTASDEFWEFEKFGDLVIATNYADEIQSYNINSSTDFAIMAASAPKAKHLAVVGDFVFAGNVDDSIDGVRPDRVWWSPIANPAGSWTPSQSTQCDYQDCADSVSITKCVGVNNDCLIATERNIQRFVYVGTPTIFNRYVVENSRGCEIPRSVIPFKGGFFYYSTDGFHFFNGSMSEPIGNTRVDKYFQTDLDQTNQARMNGVIDPNKSIVQWAYPGQSNNAGLCNKIITYNWAEGRWSDAEIETEFLFSGLSSGYTLEELDNISSSLDALPYSLDSRLYTGGRKNVYAFNEDHKLGSFDSDTYLDAVMETGEFEGKPGNRSYIEKVRPLVEGSDSTITVKAGVRSKQSNTVSYGSSVSVDEDDEAAIDSDTRYHRIQVTVSGGFDNAQGVELINVRDGGFR